MTNSSKRWQRPSIITTILSYYTTSRMSDTNATDHLTVTNGSRINKAEMASYSKKVVQVMSTRGVNAVANYDVLQKEGERKACTEMQ
jgi:hypothetical protein